MSRLFVGVAFVMFLATSWPPSAESQESRLTLEPIKAPVQDWSHAAALRVQPDAGVVARLQALHQPSGNWGGPHCPSKSELRSLVDDYLATPHPGFPGLGSTVPGISLSWSSDECGTFTYAAGLQSIEEDEPMKRATLMGIASMTKPVMAAITLKLNESGVFGPTGLDTTVDRLLTPQQIRALTVGDDPTNPRCPGFTFLWNRETSAFEWTSFSCPDLSRVTLRHLLMSNHGMYDFLNEVLLPTEAWQYGDGVYFELYEFMGLDPVPPVSSTRGFEYLKAFGLKGSDLAVVGGYGPHDLEVSLGNTGFQLLGVILEKKTGKSLDQLVQKYVVKPLRIDPMRLHVDPHRRHDHIADGYEIFTGEPLIENTGIYPLADLNGHTALNTASLGLGRPANVNMAGGAAGLIANPRSYRVFLDAFVNGGLLGPAAQRELEDSFVLLAHESTPETAVLNGYGVTMEKVRGIPGFPDIDVLSHGGLLPGIRCFNPAVRQPDSEVPLVTGVQCTNSRRLGFPDPFSLVFEFVRVIVEARLSTPN